MIFRAVSSLNIDHIEISELVRKHPTHMPLSSRHTLVQGLI